jgi:hypothetical protein
MLINQVWGLQFITLEASGSEIICQLMFLMQNLKWRERKS